MLHSHIRILPQWYATSFRFLNHCSCQALAYKAIIRWWSVLMSVQLPIKDSSYWGRLILPTLKLYPHWLSSSSNFQMVSSINIPFFLGFSPSLNCSHTDYLALAEQNKPCLECFSTMCMWNFLDRCDSTFNCSYYRNSVYSETCTHNQMHDWVQISWSFGLKLPEVQLTSLPTKDQSKLCIL